jgi:dTDP-4-amino-4,6-dideoxygalactose transaminase
MTKLTIPFTRVHVTGKETEYMRQVIETSRLGGDGPFARRCEKWLERTVGCRRALLTHSGTGALEMAAILAGVEPGDEVILPSFTFASTANAFVLRGAVPVFVDIEPRTMNLDPACVERALSHRTRAIVAVHYAGVACDLPAILGMARGANAMVIEDAAQALLSTSDGHPLGSFGAMAALSFHETKNVTSGEGGCLLVNDASLIERAEVVREKGTNRTAFRRGAIDRYTWVDIGSSYLPNELTAAFLLAQLEQSGEITARRCAIWGHYHAALAPLEAEGLLVRPATGPGNAHIYFVLLPDLETRTAVIATLRKKGIVAVFHYVPLHNSPAGLRYGRVAGRLTVTENISARLLRLPLWPDMTAEDVSAVTNSLASALKR